MKSMNEAIEDAAYASAFMKKLTEVQAGDDATKAEALKARHDGENRAAHRERLRRDKAASQRLAKARP